MLSQKLINCMSYNSCFHSDTPSDIEEFFKEALIVKDLAHGNLLALRGIIIQSDVPLACFPFAENGDLKTYIRTAHENNQVRENSG